MSVNITPPISLKEIQYNFAKPLDTEIASTDRYVRDFNALAADAEFDLVDYSGAAFGLQNKYMRDGPGQPYWQSHGSIYELPLDMSDRRADYDVDFSRSKAEIKAAPSGPTAVYEECHQRYYHSYPGAVGVNGWFYASEVGASNKYKAEWVIETGDYVEPGMELWGYVFGYAAGYLDGRRATYSSHVIKNPRPNTEYPWYDEFIVDRNYRHCVQNFSVFMPGGYGRDAVGAGYFHSCKIKRKP